MHHLSPEKIEIMAPAGSFESLAAALRSGADAVYFGIGSLNMRAGAAANFQKSDLKHIMREIHFCKAKGYLALNTIVYNNELDELNAILDTAIDAKVDAVIAEDFAVITAAVNRGLSVHLSVQANISNIEAVRFYARFADVMVLARELPLSEIAQIHRTIIEENITGPAGKPIRLEIFAHGALCMAVSGHCHLSAHLDGPGFSANRGSCLQRCRRRYRVIDQRDGAELEVQNGFIFSPKDLCMIRHIGALLDAGATVLKIEGRGRSADYVAHATGAYVEALQLWQSGQWNDHEGKRLEKSLAEVFNRTFWYGGYYLGDELEKWNDSTGSSAQLHKIALGKVINWYSRSQIAEVRLDAGDLSVGDRLLATGPITGAFEWRLESMRSEDGQPRTLGKKGEIVTFFVPGKIRRSDKLYRLEQRAFGMLPVRD